MMPVKKWRMMNQSVAPGNGSMTIAPVYKSHIIPAPKSSEAKKEVIIAPVTKQSSVCTIRYHVTDAKKYLASVTKMTQCGNRIVFDSDRSYIQSKKTGQEMDLISEGGVYTLDVIFLNGETAERGKILIDSGAADNVMPADGLKEVPMSAKDQNVHFSTASGQPMANYGRKDVEFVPAAFWESEFGYPFQGRSE